MDLSSVVISVLGQLANLAIKRASQLNSVRKKVVAWKVELVLIQGKLKDVESKDNNSNEEKAWMDQLRVVANQMRDVIETYQKIEEDDSEGLTKIRFTIYKKPLMLHDLFTKIKIITKDFKRLQKCNPQPDIQLAITVSGTQVGTTSSGTGTDDPTPIPLSSTNKPSDIEDPEVVGLDSDKHRILKHLLDETISRRTILSIVGVGGLGKTTLAQKVYNSSILNEQFQCHAWLSISQTFNKNNILREILYSIKPEMKDKELSLEEKYLLMEIKSYLNNKRYLIILDDVWTKDVWDGLSKALPEAYNGSRVIITTRNVDVARAADRNTKEYQLRFLTDDESVALLFRTALQRSDIQPKDYPPHLKDVTQRLIKKCGGLPLALVVLGGILLFEDDTFSAWDKVYETMYWHNEDGENCMKTLAKSYEGLPNDHLKQCFLYFAFFPEDHNILAKQMTRMWVANEFIPKPRGGTLEDQAEKYLKDLVKRCLVQVTEKSANGNCKRCRMHDLVRDLAIHKAQKEKLTLNHMTLQYNSSINDDDMDSANTRSLLCFGVNMPKYQGFKELRVLLFDRIYMTMGDVSSFKNWLEGLVQLRYLGFRYCLGVEFLRNISFSGLKSLETLDCKGTNVTPNPSLWEIPTLRHVIGTYLANCPLNWSRLKNLQTIKWAKVECIPTVECNVNLRALCLSIRYPGKDETPPEGEWQRLHALLSRTEHLVFLRISAYSSLPPLSFLSAGSRGLPCHEKIQSLYLCGGWTCVPSVEMFPKNLTKLELRHSKLVKDLMPILERLQSLRILHLFNAHSERKMICSARGFPNLIKLKLEDQSKLSEWEIEEGAMPVLSHLEIHCCKNLHTLPELQNVASLQELIVTGASNQLQVRSKTEDRHKIEHIPSVYITTFVRSLTTMYKGPRITSSFATSLRSKTEDQHKIEHIPSVSTTTPVKSLRTVCKGPPITSSFATSLRSKTEDQHKIEHIPSVSTTTPVKSLRTVCKGPPITSSFATSLRSKTEDQHKIEHIPSVNTTTPVKSLRTVCKGPPITSSFATSLRSKTEDQHKIEHIPSVSTTTPVKSLRTVCKGPPITSSFATSLRSKTEDQHKIEHIPSVSTTTPVKSLRTVCKGPPITSSFATSLRSKTEDQHKIEHIPSVNTTTPVKSLRTVCKGPPITSSFATSLRSKTEDQHKIEHIPSVSTTTPVKSLRTVCKGPPITSSFATSLRSKTEDQHKIEHIPSVSTTTPVKSLRTVCKGPPITRSKTEDQHKIEHIPSVSTTTPMKLLRTVCEGPPITR